MEEEEEVAVADHLLRIARDIGTIMADVKMMIARVGELEHKVERKEGNVEARPVDTFVTSGCRSEGKQHCHFTLSNFQI